jgi:LDH2 family malate/lactate/ureidoglycolate dehydrogenase
MTEAARYFMPEDGRAFIVAAYRAVGLPAADAASVAELMLQADLRGTDTHGIARLPIYAQKLKSGAINKSPNIRIVEEAPATALIDGDNGMGHLVMKRAAELAVEKARVNGIGWVGARASNHAGAAAPYAMIPLAHDMIGLYLAVAEVNHMAPTGGIEALLGTNPIAIAIPAQDEPPIVHDVATTVASNGRVGAVTESGGRFPEGWMIDRAGKPVTDPKRAQGGTLLPIGGYKGYGLALVFALMGGALNGTPVGRDAGSPAGPPRPGPSNTGQAIMALDIARFGPPDHFKRTVDKVVRDLRASEPLPGAEPVRYPGLRGHETAVKATKEGIPLRPATLAALEKLAVGLAIERLKLR